MQESRCSLVFCPDNKPLGPTEADVLSSFSGGHAALRNLGGSQVSCPDVASCWLLPAAHSLWQLPDLQAPASCMTTSGS